MQERRAFLDVAKSARGLAWCHRLDQRQENLALVMTQSHGLAEIVARVLAARNVGPDEARQFLDPTIRGLLPDPLRLTDMDRAARRLADAVERRERVAIFGDYDVDGAASSALLSRYLRHFGVANEIYIPDRIFEGYGPNEPAMRELAARVRLIVTVDCGTNSAGPIAAAIEAGADVVVIDHHQVAGELPACSVVVNPNREDDLSGQGHLCAAGVVFLVLVRVNALLRERGRNDLPDLLGLLHLVGLATVCDVVPLIGINRAFVAKGLVAARQMQSAGLAALARSARIAEPLNIFHLGFLLGPRINAGGRIGDAALGAKLLASDNPDEAAEIAATLERLNQERQAMEQEALAEACAEAEAELAVGDGPAILVTASEKWHPGIAGLVAARLKEQTRRPAFAIAFNANGTGTGSGRSIAGFDLGRLVREAVAEGLAVKGGGHAMAAGITVERSMLGRLRGFFEEHAREEVARLRSEEALRIDAAVAADGATLDLVDLLESAGPYGTGHPAPVLALPLHRIRSAREVGSGHVRVDLRSQTGASLQAIAFRSADSDLGRFLFANQGNVVHVAGNLAANFWNGDRRPQLRILDAAPAA